MQTDTPSQLVADIGGTNARFALADRDSALLQQVRKLPTADYPDLLAATRAYLGKIGGPAPRRMCIAVAGPVADDQITMTNNHWHFSRRELQQSLGLEQLHVINDFEAMAWGVSAVQSTDLVAIGGGSPEPGKPKAVIGPGTGFGVALLLESSSGPKVIATEGGHTSLGPRDSNELAVLSWLIESDYYPSRETLLSGNGLEHIYQALSTDRANAKIPAPRIQASAVDGEDPVAVAALETFCAMLGTAAGDQALASGAQGGVYITGGIVRRFIPFLQRSQFRERFDSHGPLRHYLEKIPVYVVVTPHQGLMGAALAR